MLTRSNAVSNLSAVSNGAAPSSTPTATKPSTGQSGFGNFNFGTNLFGQSQNTQQQVDPILQRLHKIRDAFSDKSDTYRFYSVVQNISTSQPMSQPPKFVDPKEWEKAKQNPALSRDHTTPFQVNGFDGLNQRLKSQKDIVEKMEKKLEDLKSRVVHLKKQYDTEFVKTITDISKNSSMISASLLDLLQFKETEALPDYPFSPKEHELLDRLQRMQNDLKKPNKYQAALNSLNLKATLISESGMNYPDIKLNDKVDATESIIKSNHEAIEALVNVIQKLRSDTNLLENSLSENSDHPSSGVKNIINNANSSG